MNRKLIGVLTGFTFTSFPLPEARKAASEDSTVLVFKYTGQRQCQSLATFTRQAARDQLTQSGVRVLS